eukprot:gene9575-1778_t
MDIVKEEIKKELILEDDNIIKEGDRMIIHLFDDNLIGTIAKKSEKFECKFGTFYHAIIIGKPFGSKIYNDSKTGHIHVLKADPYMWTLALPHRTQILYEVDISMIKTYLNLKPGSRVVESGTGSGSLSMHLIQTIKPNGHLFTFEFHKERHLEANVDFGVHKLTDYVTGTHRDVMNDGFVLENGNIVEEIDAVFLDLPKPWDCIQHVNKVLKKNGYFCGFSPCIEQVQQTCLKLKEFKYTDVKTIECLSRDYFYKSYDQESLSGETTKVKYMKPKEEMAGHTGYLTFAKKTQ